MSVLSFPSLPSPSTLAQLAQLGVSLKELHALLDPGTTGNDRWDALQGWLKRNPEWEKRINVALHCPPDLATHRLIALICEEYGLSHDLLVMADPSGSMRQAVTVSIGQIQELYKERQLADIPAAPLMIEDKPKKGRKKKNAR